MKLHATYLTIVLILLGLLFFQQQCKRPVKPDVVVTHDTIPGDPFPVLVHVGQPDPVYVDQPYILPAIIDTMGVIIDYFSKYYYADTLKDDSSAFIALYETVKGNRIIDRSFSFQNKRATVVNNYYPAEKTKLYAGAMVAIRPSQQLDIGPAVMLITKKGYGYSYAYGVNERTHTLSFVWKISLRKNHPPGN
jgi:hypothetical protein